MDVIVRGLVFGGTSFTSRKNYMRDPPYKRFHPLEDSSIMFKEKEAEHHDPNHDDALVVSLKIINILVKRILVDMGSFTDILYDNDFLKIRLNVEDLHPISSMLLWE